MPLLRTRSPQGVRSPRRYRPLSDHEEAGDAASRGARADPLLEEHTGCDGLRRHQRIIAERRTAPESGPRVKLHRRDLVLSGLQPQPRKPGDARVSSSSRARSAPATPCRRAASRTYIRLKPRQNHRTAPRRRSPPPDHAAVRGRSGCAAETAHQAPSHAAAPANTPPREQASTHRPARGRLSSRLAPTRSARHRQGSSMLPYAFILRHARDKPGHDGFRRKGLLGQA